jgi:hypothetical protein
MRGIASSSRVAAAGIISPAITSAAGALISDAVRMWPMAFGTASRDQRRVEHHDGAGDGGHARGHQGEQRAAAHVAQIGFDQQRRLDHADEHIGRRTQAKRAADAERVRAAATRIPAPAAAARASGTAAPTARR